MSIVQTTLPIQEAAKVDAPITKENTFLSFNACRRTNDQIKMAAEKTNPISMHFRITRLTAAPAPPARQ